MNKLFGIIGTKLSHSFSPKYFNNKFNSLGLKNHYYQTIEITQINNIENFIKTHPSLIGFNVTIPYKEQILQLLDTVDTKANQVGAVNTVQIKKGKLHGYNTDIIGFEHTLKKSSINQSHKVLVLGSGGASKAIQWVLKEKKISFSIVSRDKLKADYSYKSLKSISLTGWDVIINCTPLGMFPLTNEKPDLLYHQLSSNHLLIDLTYNPPITSFLKEGMKNGCFVSNGFTMLVQQAEAAWGIWTK